MPEPPEERIKVSSMKVLERIATYGGGYKMILLVEWKPKVRRA